MSRRREGIRGQRARARGGQEGARARTLILQQGAPGGIGRVELLLQRALGQGEEEGFEVQTISRHPPREYFVEASQPHRKLVVVRNPIRFALRSLRAAVLARPDVIVDTHVNIARLHTVIRWLRPGARTVLFIHGREVWRSLSWLRQLALRSCTRMVALTGFVAGTVHAAHGSSHAPIEIVPAGLSDGWADGVVARSDPTGHAMVLTVSRLQDDEQEKGVDRVLAAFPRVLEQVSGATLRIVGDGTDRPRLERIARTLGVAERVRFLGSVDDAALKRLYATSDVFALPSVQEGFGLVYLEAMAHGLPCVIASGTATAEVVDPGGTGIAVDPGDVDQLADAICVLLNDRACWLRMSRAAADAFQERYREAVFGRRIRRVLLGAD